MVLIKAQFFVLALSLFLQINQCKAEGFLAGTMVKIPDGYERIEEIYIGDRVVCLDNEKNNVESYVTYVGKKSVEQYACLQFGNERVGMACDQLFWHAESDSWVDALSLQDGGILKRAKVDVYLIGIAHYHNYFVTKNDMCVHNFLSPLVAVLSVAFGFGSVELTSIGVGLAGLGAFLGYRWHKKDKENHKIVPQLQFYGGGMMPEDPEDEKKRKRDEARREYKPLTNQEARDKAEELGYREAQDHPCGNTFSKPVFFNGKNYISPDRTGHKGGVWKMFNKNGDRLITANIDLTVFIGT